jgi:hypothetical protein
MQTQLIRVPAAAFVSRFTGTFGYAIPVAGVVVDATCVEHKSSQSDNVAMLDV